MAEKIKKKISELKRHSVSLSLISLALIIAISGMFAINGTLGWYAHNDEVDVNGMNVKISATDGIVADVKYYPITSISLASDDEKNYNVYRFGIDEVTGENAMLGSFSALTAERQLLMVIMLKDDVESVKLSASTSSEYILDGEISRSGNPLSSVIELRVVTDPNGLQMTNEHYVIPDTATIQYHFATLNEENGVITDADIQSNLQLGEFQGSAIFIILDYYEDGTKYVMDYVNEHLDEVKVDEGSSGMIEEIKFTCDFTINVE